VRPGTRRIGGTELLLGTEGIAMRGLDLLDRLQGNAASGHVDLGKL
jgi:hypothetical protein